MPSGYRALIVDEDVSMQRLGSHALRQQGFQCECAADGEEAEAMIHRSPYDVVVTELKLTKKNGYNLILELLKSPAPPVIVVYTEVIEPRLIKDLLVRGVDDILAKPVHGAFLAGKIRALVDERASRHEAGPTTRTAVSAKGAPAPPPAKENEGLPISLTQLNRKLADVKSVLPVSSAALEVYEMIRGCDWEVSQIAAAIQLDASLTADVLRLANSHLYNPTGKRIVQVDQAVMRIGQNRVGELALAASALARLTPEVIPWLDLELTWKRSMAAGLLMESLIDAGGHQSIEEGLLLSAIMYPLGRVALGMLFPKEYQQMVALCEQTGESLQEQERRALPTSHVQVTAHLLASWNIPPDVYLPLKFALDEYSSLVRLSEPLRTKAELVKVAVLLGRLAAGPWQSWDLVQLPSAAMLKRLKIVSAAELIDQARSDLAKLAAFTLREGAKPSHVEPVTVGEPIAYCDIAGASNDLFAALLPSMGFEPASCSAESLTNAPGPSVVNCLSVSPKRLPATGLGKQTVIVADQEKRASFNRLATTIALPNSYGQLRAGLLGALADEGDTGGRGSWVSKISRRKSRSGSTSVER